MHLRNGEPEEADMSAARIRRVAQLAAGWVEQGITPALVVLVARHGIIVLHQAFGRLGSEPDAPGLTIDAIFPLASISKPITATAVMLLVEDGMLSLNRPVAEYIPEFSGEGKHAVMVHHLLTHTSGLRDDDLLAHAYTKRGSDAITPEDEERQRLYSTYANPTTLSVDIPPPDETQHPAIHTYLFLRRDAPSWKPPGVEMAYADYNYNLLGEIVRRVSGQSLAAFAEERIFAPLGMQDTSYIVPDPVQRRIVRRPPDAPFAALLDSTEFQREPWGADGVLSTALDMAIFGQMFLDHGTYGDTRILSSASVAEMTRNQIPGIPALWRDESFPEASWGYGWGIRGNKKYLGTLCSPATFDHGGWGGVYLWVDPVYEMVGAYFSVCPRLRPDDTWDSCGDLFVNAVMAGVVEE